MAEQAAYRYDGATASELAALLGVPHVELFDEVTSTLDIAHALARDGALAGTVIIADRQTAGRGRSGKSWTSPSGGGVWLTTIERPADREAIDVLSIRVGLGAARALDRFAPEPVRLKWPNDLLLDDGKVGGILVEARWRESALEWVAIGLGVNVTIPGDVEGAAALEPGTSRIDVIAELVPELAAAAAATGSLTDAELEEYRARDMALGKECVEPAIGRVRGINRRGELLVALADSVVAYRTGSLVLSDSPARGDADRVSYISGNRPQESN